RLRVLEDEPELGCREAPIDRHRDRAEVVGREDRREELVAVVGEQADDVAGTDAARVQTACERGGPLGHPAIRHDVVAADRERLVGCAARVVLEHADPAHVRLRPGFAHGAAYPPSTTIADPVVHRDASLARYEYAPTRSSAEPRP